MFASRKRAPASLHTDVFSGGKKTSSATKGQSKLLTSSHGNRGETDKGLPRKATFRLQRKTLPFNLTLLPLQVSLLIAMRLTGKNNNMIMKSWFPRHVNSHRYLCVCKGGMRVGTGGRRVRRSRDKVHMRPFRSLPRVTARGKTVTTHFARSLEACRYVAVCESEG